MKMGAVYDSNKQLCLIARAAKTANVFERMRGLLSRPEPAHDEGLWIEPCPSVHTIGMRYAIDVVFLDKYGTVRKIAHALRPLRFAACPEARTALELRSGNARRAGIQEGMTLEWIEWKDRDK